MFSEGGEGANYQGQPRSNVRSSQKRENKLWKQVHESLQELKDRFKQPFLLTYPSKKGQVFTGSSGVSEKFKEEYMEDDDWKTTFDTDQKSLCSIQETDQSRGQRIFTERGRSIPLRLPADLDLMVLKDLNKWLMPEILKDYWRRGGKRRQVVFGIDEFKPSFWPNSIYPWSEIKKSFTKMKKTDYNGPGNVTYLLKKAIDSCLSSVYNIDARDYVDPSFSDEVRKRRLKRRGVITVTNCDPNNSREEENDDPDNESVVNSSGGEKSEDISNSPREEEDTGNNDEGADDDDHAENNTDSDEFSDTPMQESTPNKSGRDEVNKNLNNSDLNSSFGNFQPRRPAPSNLRKTKNVPKNICKICRDILDGEEEEIFCCGLKFHTTCIRYMIK